MRVGIDFDNTIADYKDVFHVAAMERGLIEASLPKSKNAVRDFLNGAGRQDDFTALQGYVYGARMDLARPYPGFGDFIAAARTLGHHLYIVSHKTRRPLQGPDYDMHEAARAFLRDHGFSGVAAIPPEHIFFEERKEEKIGRAAALAVDVFIDDLPEILAMPGLPAGCRRILFAPDGTGPATGFEACRSWNDIAALLLRARP